MYVSLWRAFSRRFVGALARCVLRSVEVGRFSLYVRVVDGLECCRRRGAHLKHTVELCFGRGDSRVFFLCCWRQVALIDVTYISVRL